MTDDQQKALIAELVAIREGMATKADLLKLEEGLTGVIIKLAETSRSATQTVSVSEAGVAAECLRSCAKTILENHLPSLEAAAYIESYADTVLKAASVPSLARIEKPAVDSAKKETTDPWQLPDWICTNCAFVNYGVRTKCRNCGKSVPSRTPANPAQCSSPTSERPLALWEKREAEIEADIARLTDRVDRLSNWYQDHRRVLELLHQRLERLEGQEEKRSATQTEQPARDGNETLAQYELRKYRFEIANGWVEFDPALMERIERAALQSVYPNSVPTPAAEPPENNSTKTNTEEK